MAAKTELASVRPITKKESLIDLNLRDGKAKMVDFSNNRREYGK